MTEHQPLDFYSQIQRNAGVTVDFMRPLRHAGALAGMTVESASTLVIKMRGVFGENLAATLLRKHSPDKCQKALENINARFVHLKNACNGQLGDETIRQMVNAHTEFLFISFERFLAAVENLKQLIPGAYLRAMFLNGHAQYFTLPIEQVSALIERGLSMEQCEGSCDLLWKHLSEDRVPPAKPIGPERPKLTLISSTTSPKAGHVRVRSRQQALLAQMTAEKTAAAPAPSSDPAPVPPPPAEPEAAPKQQPPRNSWRQAFINGGWNHKSADKHLRELPFLRAEENGLTPEIVGAAMSAATQRLDLFGMVYAKRLMSHAHRYADFRQRALIAPDGTPSPEHLRQEWFESFLVGAHCFDNATIDFALDALERIRYLDPLGLLRTRPELLAWNGRPLANMLFFMDKWHYGMETLRKRIDFEQDRLVLLEHPEAFGLEERLIKRETVVNVLRSERVFHETDCRELSPVHELSRLYQPVSEFALRLVFLSRIARRFPRRDFAEAVFQPTRADFMAHVAHVTRPE